MNAYFNQDPWIHLSRWSSFLWKLYHIVLTWVYYSRKEDKVKRFNMVFSIKVAFNFMVKKDNRWIYLVIMKCILTLSLRTKKRARMLKNRMSLSCTCQNPRIIRTLQNSTLTACPPWDTLSPRISSRSKLLPKHP